MLLKLDTNKHLSMATREDWKAYRYRLKPGKLYTPVNYVKFSCTYTGMCQDNRSCGNMVRAIQETMLDNGFWDIPYNFLVGGDGVLYEGRGWDLQPDLPPEYTHLQDDCIDIAYVGDYTVEDPPWEMVKTAFALLQYGVLRTNESCRKPGKFFTPGIKINMAAENPENLQESIGKNSYYKKHKSSPQKSALNYPLLHVGMNKYVKFSTRRAWGALSPKESSGYLCKPATHVRLTTTRTDFVNTQEDCVKTLRLLQSYYMNKGLCDIPYNFVVGGDNCIYEGRGFLWNPLLKEEYGEADGKILDIALMGTFQNENPPISMMFLALDIINSTIFKKALIYKYELISFPEERKPAINIQE